MEFDKKHIEEFKQFLVDNKEHFDEELLNKAKNVRDKIEEIRLIGNIHLISNAHKLVNLVLDDKREELVSFAQIEGVAWAGSELTLELKLEWIQSIRSTLWNFLHRFDELSEEVIDINQVYEMGNRVNGMIDQFLRGFFVSYSTYKDNLIAHQKKLVNHLSVPIIPIAETVSVIPLIGTIDLGRARIIEEKILMEISKKRITLLFFDLSGIAEVEEDTMHHLLNILRGVEMMGCHPVITGLQPKIVQTILREGLDSGLHAETKASLQQALKDHLTVNLWADNKDR
ncbi:STAS domain-containing protein [Aciduricibacillus chroicocephali]|uniref:STAS domain-containing protein n=1 Tax=Aciduricibacillus chroicocephali TaxID=3054939 RepID=A0ABY9KYG5_9BACI|nr:STAS domain-containing protein [Bacillaceae bacterium 44XB]